MVGKSILVGLRAMLHFMEADHDAKEPAKNLDANKDTEKKKKSGKTQL